MNINYKDIQENHDKFIIYHDFIGNRKLRFIFSKITQVSNTRECFLFPIMKLDGIFTPKDIFNNTDNDMKDLISTIQYKRSKYKKYDRTIFETINIKYKSTKYKQCYGSPSINNETTLKLYYNNEPSMSYDDYVNIFQDFFSYISLSVKKKILISINRLRNKFDEYSIISFMKCINNVFEIKYRYTYNLNINLKSMDNNTMFKTFEFNGGLKIDTIEHFDMVNKCIEFDAKIRAKKISDRNKNI